MKSLRHLVCAMFALSVLMLAQTPSASSSVRYQPNWQSLNQRPIPAWFDQAKFGIFIHWGVYSVPAYADPSSKIGESYAEWYWNHMHNHDGATWKFHEKTYGANVKYQDFAPQFKARLYDPDQWAELFKDAGARYVVLTSKHHDGFCLWPSPQSWNWNAVDVGPHRDLLGDLTKAVRAQGLRMGYYYSLYEWYNPLYHSDVHAYVEQHMIPQMKDLVTRYQPDILWTDGEWEQTSATWEAPKFLAWLLNDSPVKDKVVINDRWGKETRSKDGGFYTSEYSGTFNPEAREAGTRHKWEEDQGIGKSFGYNREETVSDYKAPEALIRLLVDTVSRGGNLLLDIGPTADGRIPVIMQERLLQMGSWLKVNGEAIYGSHPWKQAGEGDTIRYTRNGDAVYAIALAWPGSELTLHAPQASSQTTVELLGQSGTLHWSERGGSLHIQTPAFHPNNSALRYACVFRLTHVK